MKVTAANSESGCRTEEPAESSPPLPGECERNADEDDNAEHDADPWKLTEAVEHGDERLTYESENVRAVGLPSPVRISAERGRPQHEHRNQRRRVRHSHPPTPVARAPRSPTAIAMVTPTAEHISASTPKPIPITSRRSNGPSWSASRMWASPNAKAPGEGDLECEDDVLPSGAEEHEQRRRGCRDPRIDAALDA